MNSTRYRLVVGLFLGVTVVMLLRMLVLATYDREFLQEHGDRLAHREVSLTTTRGVIYDRTGQPIAISTPVYSIWTDPGIDAIAESSYPELAEALQISESALEETLWNARNKRFVYLKKRASHQVSEAVAQLSIEGVRFTKDYKRYYPAAEVTAHVVGLTRADGVGVEGLELSRDRLLRGEEGKRRILRGRDGRVVRDVNLVDPPRFGIDTTTSIDLGLQYLVFRQLRETVMQHDAQSATLVMIDVFNGEILSLATYPSYNPNDGMDRALKRMRNRAVADTYEPGSTIKPFAALAALESGRYSRDTVVETSPGYMGIGRHLVEDPRDYGPLTLEGVLVKSSQVGISKIALDLDEFAIYDVLRRSGILDVPNTGLPHEAEGHINPDELQREIGRATLSYGYGLRISPLQLAIGYLTLATGGVRRSISIVRDSNRYLPPDERVFDAQHSRQILEMLQGVVSPIGTAPGAYIEEFAVSGKTGTVRKISKGQYDDTRHIAWFVGMAPATNPRILAVVVVDEPQGITVSGGGVAAPVFAAVARHALQLMGISVSSTGIVFDGDAA